MELRKKEVSNDEGDVVVSEGRPKNFVEATREEIQRQLHWDFTPLLVEGINIVIEVDQDDIEKKALRCQHDVIGRIPIKREKIPTRPWN